MESTILNSSTRDRSRSRSRDRRGRSRSRSRDRNSNNQRQFSSGNGNKYRRGSQSPPNDRETYDGGSKLNSGPGYRNRLDRDGHSSSFSSNSADRKYSQRVDFGNNRQALSTNDNSQRSSRQQQQQQFSRRRDDDESTQREPQVEVILQGLPLEFQEDDVRTVVETRDIGLESIRIVRDRYTGESKGFGFLKFVEPQYAQDFVKEFSPSIGMGQNRVRIAFSNNPSGSRETSRRCAECDMTNGAHREDCHRSSPSKQVGHASEGRSSRGYGTNNTSGGNRTGAEMESGYDMHQQQQYHNQQQQHFLNQNQSLTSAYQPQPLNVGARDIGGVPNSILIVTDLPSLVNESGIWNAMSLLGPLVRVMLAKDRQSKISWGYCFAEFSDIQGATMALEKAQGMAFTIQKKAVEIHYAHHGSFIPAYAPTQWTIDYGSEGQLAIYWDEQAFLSVYASPSSASRVPTASSHPKNTAAAAKTTGSETDELSAFYAVMGDVLQTEPPRSGAGSSIFAVPTFGGNASSTGAGAVVTVRTAEAGAVIPPSIPTPVVPELPSIPTTAKIDKAQLAGIAAAQAAEQLAKAEEKKRKAGPGLPSSVIGIGGGGKKVSIQLQKWSNMQATSDLAPTAHGTGQEAPPTSSSPPSSMSSQTSSTSTMRQQELIYEPDELLDLKINACLLCQRRLKSLQDLRKHQSLSDLHKKNLLDRSAIEAALAKSRGTTAVGTSSSSSISSVAPSAIKAQSAVGEEEPKYRDRAAERRQIFGQPDYPLPPMPSGRDFGGSGGGARGNFNNSNPYARGGSNTAYGNQGIIIPEQPTKDGIKEDNVGNRLLKSMGWKEGQGLGKDGEGIKAPIQASGYAKGVGIGAGLQRKADGSGRGGPLGNYAESAKELARRRYEQSGL
ncbi:hypothetical protein BGX30_004638 [Mortierella sp. GBA39]|nr:hypothetical protein BGX30_004638 [Mortierella sp. GBA39]